MAGTTTKITIETAVLQAIYSTPQDGQFTANQARIMLEWTRLLRETAFEKFGINDRLFGNKRCPLPFPREFVDAGVFPIY